MRRKRIFLAMLLLAGMGTGAFFLATTSPTPLAVRIIGLTNQPNGNVNIYFTISNSSPRHCYFFAYAQIFSSGQWLLDDTAGKPIGTTEALSAHAARNMFIRASDRPGMRRLHLRYQLRKSSRRDKIDELMTKVRLGPIPYRSELWDFTTAPFELPPR